MKKTSLIFVVLLLSQTVNAAELFPPSITAGSVTVNATTGSQAQGDQVYTQDSGSISAGFLSLRTHHGEVKEALSANFWSQYVNETAGHGYSRSEGNNSGNLFALNNGTGILTANAAVHHGAISELPYFGWAKSVGEDRASVAGTLVGNPTLSFSGSAHDIQVASGSGFHNPPNTIEGFSVVTGNLNRDSLPSPVQ